MLLPLGVVVALTWALALWGPPAPGVEIGPLRESERVWLTSVPSGWPPPVQGGGTRSISASCDIRSGWIPRGDAAARGVPVSYGQSVLRVGWPFRALQIDARSEIFDGTPRPRRVDTFVGALGPLPSQFHRETSWGFLPLRPVWPGLLLDWLIAGVLLWLVRRVVHDRRRRRRLRRRLCPQCTYPMGSSERCPECGTPYGPAPNRASTATTATAHDA